jgi:hypothetical protein
LKKASVAGSLTASVPMIGDMKQVNKYIDKIKIKKIGGNDNE